MNADSLKAKIKNVAIITGLSAPELIQIYFIDQFLIRTSKSKYAKNFIIKGGMFVVAYLGVANRSTQDIDATIKGKALNSVSSKEIYEAIQSIKIDDGIKFELKNIEEIIDK